MSEPTMAGRRDASFYNSPGFASKYHIVLWPSKSIPACNASGFVLLMDDKLRAAADVPEHMRCRRAGCRTRWPSAGDGTNGSEPR